MTLPVSVNQKQLLDVLLNVALVRPVFIWGAPGIGKSSSAILFAVQTLGSGRELSLIPCYIWRWSIFRRRSGLLTGI